MKIAIAGGKVSPVAKQVEVGVGDTITFDITSDRDGALHVHSSPEHEFEISPGRTTEKVTLDKPGVVDVEEHVSDTLVLRITVQ